MINLLEGVRVLECAMLPTGDKTSRPLGDLGADVIKVERPGTGDYLRELGDRIADQDSVLHLFCNRNKRSIELNLRDEGSAFRHQAPAPGEHTQEVLAEIGYSAEDVAELHARGAL